MGIRFQFVGICGKKIASLWEFYYSEVATLSTNFWTVMFWAVEERELLLVFRVTDKVNIYYYLYIFFFFTHLMCIRLTFWC